MQALPWRRRFGLPIAGSLCPSPTRRTIGIPRPPPSGKLPAAQEQKQINDLTGGFELCICSICDQRSGGTTSPHGDCAAGIPR